MRPADLTPAELVDLLDDAYQEDRGGPPAGLALAEREALADYLGCHEEARAEALHLWQERLAWQGGDTDDAAYWLDVEFVGPGEGNRAE
ncbi:hypothetical protein [Deinococcus apachensis]|uniref:hypothetical protein n=1 Tax=Deinococcus apachensis TaxID=309886 RepID=UPI0003679F8A|nr:hypothetical protein [Deinococcus apachensis]